jgi:uncharacterized membrane protein YgaE (UPF0421/DUF939 family)
MQKEISITEANDFMSSWVNNYKKEQEDNKYQAMLDSFSKEELVQNYEALLSEKFALEKNLDLLKNQNNFLKEENERLQLSLLVSARNS